MPQPTSEGGAGQSTGIRRITLPQLAAIVGIAAVLHIAQDVFLPLSIAMLITFALSPAVNWLRRLGIPQLVTVLAVVVATFFAITLFFLIVAGQLGQLAQNLPRFQSNIIAKVDAIQEAGNENRIIRRLTHMMTAINSEIGSALPGASDGSGQPAAATVKPLQVEVVETKRAFQMLTGLVLPLVSPIATVGLVFVLVIFMLLERDELRDRFIRLVGSNDLHRTTELLEEAGSRVTRYLLVQLLVNVIYAVPIGIGLWLIGVPNALLWAMLTLVLRFVPYIGSVLSAAFPLFLAFAVSPGWHAVLWTAALFAVVELVTSNVIEPWLYGSRTGVSPLAIIIAAIFWTYIWGTAGLVLSTPLTVCLVVLGRHIPQFELFGILFGDEPVLAPPSRLYQRLLAGDAVEATSRAEEELEQLSLTEFYRSVGLPALVMGQRDLDRGHLTGDQQERVAVAAQKVIDDLDVLVPEERALKNVDLGPDAPRMVCFGGRNRIDDVLASILAQVLQVSGVSARPESRLGLTTGKIGADELSGVDCVILCFLDPNPSRVSLLHMRRLKAVAPDLRVGLVLWTPGEADGIPTRPAKMREARDLGADFIATDLDTVVAEVLRGKVAAV